MPEPTSGNFEKAYRLQEETDTLHPYLSKSRVMQYIKNPHHFFLVYVRGLREPENQYMRRGTAVHAIYEAYYENIIETFEAEGGVYGDVSKYLPPSDEWADWVEPYVTNFLLFEERRLAECSSVADFVPVAVEGEVWDFESPVTPLPLMGFADVILHAASVPEVDADEGVVIIDFKTGNGVKAEKYQEEPGSVLDELEYYAMLFEAEYDVAALAGYYPRDDLLLTTVPEESRRSRLCETIAELTEKGTDADEYEVKEGPLCKWGPADDQQSAFYNVCPCSWGTKSGAGPTFCDDEKRPIT